MAPSCQHQASRTDPSPQQNSTQLRAETMVKLTHKLPNVPSEFLEKISFSASCSCCLVAPSCKHQACIRLPERTLRHSKTAPNCVPKPCSNLPTKTVNVPSEFLEKISFSVSCSCCLVAPSCKHQASRTHPSPQQNST